MFSSLKLYKDNPFAHRQQEVETFSEIDYKNITMDLFIL